MCLRDKEDRVPRDKECAGADVEVVAVGGDADRAVPGHAGASVEGGLKAWVGQALGEIGHLCGLRYCEVGARLCNWIDMAVGDGAREPMRA